MGGRDENWDFRTHPYVKYLEAEVERLSATPVAPEHEPTSDRRGFKLSVLIHALSDLLQYGDDVVHVSVYGRSAKIIQTGRRVLPEPLGPTITVEWEEI